MPRELTEGDVQEFRARVGEAASALYDKGGEGAITMREIARVLGSSPMGLYRYFRDRDDIITYLRIAAFNKFAHALEIAFAIGSDPFARARFVGRAYLDFALKNPSDYRLMFDLSQPNEQGNDELARASARSTRTVTRHVDDLREAGIVSGDSKEIGRALWAAAHGVIVLHLAGRLPKDTDVRELYFETMRLTFRGARVPSSKVKSLVSPKRSPI